MPNVRVAKVDDAKLFQLVDSLRELPDPLIDEIVVTQFLCPSCITTSTARIAASSDTSEEQLVLVREAIQRAGVELPTDWRYWPELPEFPETEVYFHGLKAEELDRILREICVLHFKPIIVGTTVFDLLMKSAPYAEIRAFPRPDVDGIICAESAASKLNPYLDIELFAICSGQRCMKFSPKAATPAN